MKNYYQILGLVFPSNEDQIKKAYRKLSLKFHPDQNNGDVFFQNMFNEIDEAYKVLGNPEKKQKYDQMYLGHFTEQENAQQNHTQDNPNSSPFSSFGKSNDNQGKDSLLRGVGLGLLISWIIESCSG